MTANTSAPMAKTRSKRATANRVTLSSHKAAGKHFNKSMPQDTTSFISTPRMQNFHALIAIPADLRNSSMQ